MKFRYLSLFWILLLIGRLGWGSETEILWLKLDKIFSYKDIDKYCSTRDTPISFFFGAELLDGKILAATFKSNTSELLAERLALTTNEISTVKLTSDTLGRKWIEHFSLSARQLNWIFTRGGGGFDACVPTQALATLGPNEFNYIFNLSDILAVPQVNSNLAKFSGRRKDGHLYQITLLLSQHALVPSNP